MKKPNSPSGEQQQVWVRLRPTDLKNLRIVVEFIQKDPPPEFHGHEKKLDYLLDQIPPIPSAVYPSPEDMRHGRWDLN